MSLSHQLVAAMLAVLLSFTLGTVSILSYNSRALLITQLDAQAKNSAAHLGPYLAPHIRQHDPSAIAQAVDTLFDSGLYQSISVYDPLGHALYRTSRPAESVIDAPDWFIRLLPLTTTEQSHPLTYQQQPVGSIRILSSTNYAYASIWQTIRHTLVLFACLTGLTALVIFGLIRRLLHPLATIEHQATALARREYVEQQSLPRTPELRRVAAAMNMMVQRVRKMFDEQNRNMESLRSTAYQDNLTGLNNRRATLIQLTEHLEHHQDFGPASLLLIHLNNLQRLNQLLGEDATNHLIRHCATAVKTLGESLGPHIVGRTGGADLILLTRKLALEEWHKRLDPILHAVHNQLQQYSLEGGSEQWLSIGITSADGPATSTQLLTEARLAQQEAEQRSDCNILLYQPHQQGWPTQWRQHVADAVQNEQIFLQQQPVITPAGACVHAEVFARILDQDNSACPACDFLGAACDLGLLADIDRAIMQHALQHLHNTPDSSPLALNLSNQTLAEPTAIKELLTTLSSSPVSSRLHIEVNETAILINPDNMQQLRQALGDMSIRFGVDHFGTHPNGFSYLYALRPDYIKIDGSLVRHLEQSEEDQFFVGSLINVAHSLGIQAYAEQVERESQRQVLHRMQIDGTQGYLHGLPSAL
ncbi:EAL domain-containing protein [Marinobacterium marinum]|uniref:EAL domain-containing protein n=1 Tax=Marinobacterium marinum TaxID=2756129 RepID=A0A7W2ABD0_9GAMM|nr:EAL domain-containing protein [Marinobacterium marinum]MBA4501930.1 EAL domain-containing protein [Marinobacterium marinum]